MSYEAWNHLIRFEAKDAIEAVFRNTPINIYDGFILAIMLIITIATYNSTKSWETTAYIFVLMMIYGLTRLIAGIGSPLTMIALIALVGIALAIFKIVKK